MLHVNPMQSQSTKICLHNSQIFNWFLQTLDVTVNDEDGEKKEVKVLDIDTIGQVKSKVLDAIHRNRPYSNVSRLKPWQVDLGEFIYLFTKLAKNTQIYMGDPRPHIMPHVMVSSAMGLKFCGLMIFASHTSKNKSKTNYQ